MERVALKKDLSFSRIIYGMWRVADDADTSPSHVEAKIQAALDQGITTFDQADIYGGYTAEAIMGGALKANPALRARMEIVSKCDIVVDAGRHAGATVKHYDTSKAHINASVDASLADMGTEHIDLLLIHRPDPFMDHHETGAALDAVVASGKVGAIGVSNFKPWDWELLQSAMTNTLVTNQIEISLAEISPFTNGDLAFHQRLGTHLMAWSPLGGGSLMTGQGAVAKAMDKVAADQGVDRAAVAVAFLLAHPAKILPVMGTNNIDRIKGISDALKVKMDRQTWFKLYEAALGREVA
ncbi:aldo/keto reductase family oxidoreductase [Sulfitobacter sp. SK011]|uniref:aldo/keto reductase n=1 Tax=Sulfitobacter sp. SK011 TaxID=1389004 RepID=UPI000E0B6912|nr:aldo/keto reductase [Sulfitobacter sp. SK011]AXI43344.1 oxidoreductase [Sulfitobacter sp. SK011]